MRGSQFRKIDRSPVQRTQALSVPRSVWTVSCLLDDAERPFPVLYTGPGLASGVKRYLAPSAGGAGFTGTPTAIF